MLGKIKAPFYEVVFVWSFLALMLVIALASLVECPQSFKSYYSSQENLVVYVEGAVLRSGSYLVERGKSLSELIEGLPLQKEADVSRIKALDSKLTPHQKIIIPFRKTICVFVGGAVENSGWQEVDPSIEFCDLLQRAIPLKEANLTPWKRRKKVRDQEQIIIGFLKE
jgi:hypothetical protein